jgi:hypothetical protein
VRLFSNLISSHSTLVMWWEDPAVDGECILVVWTPSKCRSYQGARAVGAVIVHASHKVTDHQAERASDMSAGLLPRAVKSSFSLELEGREI